MILLAENKITEDFMDELESYYSKPDHLSFDDHNNAYKRDKHAFISKYKQMLTKERMFASSKQLEQDITTFCGTWKIETIGGSEMITFSYGINNIQTKAVEDED